MVTVRRTEDYLEHKGVKGMKWGYNDGSRNGRRTAAELSDVKKKAEEMAKNSSAFTVGKDFEGDYDEANNMLKYLGVTLDLQSDDEAVVRTMQIYKDMAGSKDKYKSQYDWLKTFTNRLSSIGYDMTAVSKMLDEKKDDLNKMETGTGTGNREKSNADWKENDAKATSSKTTSTKKSTKKTSSTSKDTKATKDTKKTESSTKDTKKTDSKTSSTNTTTVKRASRPRATKKTTSTTKKSYSYRPSNTYRVGNNPNYTKHSDLNQNGEELYHHGILGQRWGVRRYQNADGSLTDAGRSHYSHKAISSNKTVSELTGNGKSSSLDAKEVNKTIGRTKTTAKIANKYIDKYEDAKYKKKLSEMSDEELEKEIEKALPEYRAKEVRRQLEQRYTTVVGNPDSTKEGRDKAMKVLDVMGDVAIITIAAAPVVKAVGKKIFK